MLYFFHHYELPLIEQHAQVQLVVRSQAERASRGGGPPNTNVPQPRVRINAALPTFEAIAEDLLGIPTNVTTPNLTRIRSFFGTVEVSNNNNNNLSTANNNTTEQAAIEASPIEPQSASASDASTDSDSIQMSSYVVVTPDSAAVEELMNSGGAGDSADISSSSRSPNRSPEGPDGDSSTMVSAPE